MSDTYYTSARTELIARIGLRDTAFGAYVVFLGTILGIVFKETSPRIGVLLVVPVVAAALSTVLAQHHLLIGRLAQYLKETFTKEGGHAHWDNSESI